MFLRQFHYSTSTFHLWIAQANLSPTPFRESMEQRARAMGDGCQSYSALLHLSYLMWISQLLALERPLLNAEVGAGRFIIDIPYFPCIETILTRTSFFLSSCPPSIPSANKMGARKLKSLKSWKSWKSWKVEIALTGIRTALLPVHKNGCTIHYISGLDRSTTADPFSSTKILKLLPSKYLFLGSDPSAKTCVPKVH